MGNMSQYPPGYYKTPQDTTKKITEAERWLYMLEAFRAGVENCKRLREQKLKEELEAPRYDVIGGGKSNIVHSSVEDIMIDVFSIDQRIERIESKIAVIENAIKTLSDTEREFVKLRYLKGQSIKDIAGKLRYSDRNITRVKDTAISKLNIAMFLDTSLWEGK